jgi:hypothetical protein
MAEYPTKYFGTIAINENSGFESINVEYANNKINISLADCNFYGDKLKVCLDIIDNYIELNEIAKMTILDNLDVKSFFNRHFDLLEEEITEIFGVKDFNDIEVKEVIEKLNYPDLFFDIQNNEIQVSVDYHFSSKYSDEILCVKMDEQFSIVDFLHESKKRQ